MRQTHQMCTLPRSALGRLAVVTALAAGLLALAACAPQESVEGDGGQGASTPAVQATWSADIACDTCHAAEQATYDNASCEASHHKEVTCLQCHADEATLATVHEGKTATDALPKRLKQTNVEDAICFSCHYGDRDALIAATESTAVLTDSEGTSRNPHDPQGIAEHEDLACADCHAMHDTKGLEDRAMAVCESCHHEGVFACYTCHE